MFTNSHTGFSTGSYYSITCNYVHILMFQDTLMWDFQFFYETKQAMVQLYFYKLET